jgi:2-dehydropantoate 2-reductase
VVCVQNGVANERTALRVMPHVYGAVVMAPTAHLEPGVVQAYGSRGVGVIDLGRYPSGTDALCRDVADALGRSEFSSKPRADIMRFKYAKLIANLQNAVDAICDPGAAAEELIELAREEGRAALAAAGIEFVAPEVNDVQARWEQLEVRAIDGRPRAGSSTRQSLTRGAPTLETDYLNGEISLIGRLHGVSTAVNDALCVLSDRHVRERRPPGTLPPEEVLSRARAGHYADGPVRR